MIRSGKMNKRIIVQQYTETANTYGEPVRSYTNVAERWASVEPLSSKELITARQMASQIEMRFRTRYYRTTTPIKPKMRVVYNDENYNIESVFNVQNQNKEIELLCSKIPV